jgi:hypothetical protein
VAGAKSQRRYSELDHLIRSIYLGRYSPEMMIGMLYAAFFDTSGEAKGFDILTVAGAAAPMKKWIRFDRDWRAVLSDEGVSEFHATDFAASKGEYLEWKGDTKRRSAFLRRLIKIIKENTNKFFCCSVELAGWEEVNQEYCLEEFFYSPYALAGCAVLESTLKWARKKSGQCMFIFEDGDDGWEGLSKLCVRRQGITPNRIPKANAVPCQVGDMLAWKNRITATNSLRCMNQPDKEDDPDFLKDMLVPLKFSGI